MNRRILSIIVTLCLFAGMIAPSRPAMAMEAGGEPAVFMEAGEGSVEALPGGAADFSVRAGESAEAQQDGMAGSGIYAGGDSENLTDGNTEAGAESEEVPGNDEEGGLFGSGSDRAAEEAPEDETESAGYESQAAGEGAGKAPSAGSNDYYGEEQAPGAANPAGENTEDSKTSAETDLSGDTDGDPEAPADAGPAEEDIPLSVLELPETEIVTYYDLEEYVRAVSALTCEYDREDNATLVIDTAGGQVTTGAGEELARAGEVVMEAAELPAEEAAERLTSADYTVLSVSGDEVVISDPYETARLLVTSDTGVDTSGAVRVLNYENEYILQYATTGDAAQAADLLAGTVDSLEQDILLEIMDDDRWIYEAEAWFDEAETAAAVMNKATGEEGMFENQEDYLSWAVPYLGIDQVLAGYSEDLAQEIVVAVLDSGFDDVEGFFDSDRILSPLTVAASGDTSDVNARKHGTFVVGQIYEATPANVKILPVRVHNDEGKMTMSNLMAALRLVQGSDTHVSLVNMSIGSSGDQGLGYSGTNPDAIFREMTGEGTFFMGAAGNNSTSLAECYPAKSRYVCAVTAIDRQGAFASSYSNYGDETYPAAFSAPGSSILGVSAAADSHLTTISGTSMACPNAVACAALLMSQGKLAGLSDAAAFESALGNYVKEGLTAGTDPFRYGAGCVGFPADIDFVDLTIKNYFYNGREIKPGNYEQGLTVTAGPDILVKDIDYTVSYENNVDLGQATVIVNGIGLYEGEAIGHFNIYGKIADAEVSPLEDVQYTGNEVRPEVHVTLYGKTLSEGTDYSVTYENNVYPGQATVTVTGMGLYSGRSVRNFNIYGKLDDCEIAPVEDAVFTGNALTPDVLVTFHGKTLTKDQDYTLSCENNVEPGQAVLLVSGIGCYEGELTGSFRIYGLIGESELGPIEDVLYTGYPVTPEAAVNLHGKTLVKDTDYTISYVDNVNPGQATATVTGLGLYEGEAVGHFNIYGKIEECEIGPMEDLLYTGKALTPEPVVIFHGKTLVKDQDYTLTYTDNTLPGTATVTVEGAGFYRSGAEPKTATFRIQLATPSFTMTNEKTGVKLAWKKVGGAAGYIVYRRDGGVSDPGSFTRLKKITDPDTLAYTDKTAESGCLYTYTVRAYADGCSGKYQPAEFYRLAGVVAKAANKPASIKVTWPAVNGAGGYYVYRRKTSESKYTQIGKTGAGRLYYLDKSAVNGTNYRYFVRPYYGTYSAHFVSSTLITRVAPTSISSVSSPGKGKALVKWAKNKKATGYQVRYAYNASFTGAVTIKVKGASSLSRTLSGLTSGKKVYVKVRVYRNSNDKNWYSAWSDVSVLKVK